MVSLPLNSDAIALDVAVSNVDELLQRLATLLVGEGSAISPATVYQALVDREAQGSTGLGQGVAIPHARLPQLAHSLMAVLRTDQPLPFAAPDGEPVRLFVTVLVPQAAATDHLELLSQIATRLADTQTREALLHSQRPEAVLQLFSAPHS